MALLVLGCGGSGPGGKDALVAFEQTGGIAGHQDILEIDRDGQGRLTTLIDPKALRFELTPRTLRRLRRQLDRAQLDTLESTYEGDEDVRDDVTFRITYDDHSVQANGTAAPSQLQPLLALLQRIVDRHQRRRP